MSNVSELLINVVSSKVPKLLLGINQKGVWLVVPFETRGTSSLNHRRRGRL